ncbi:glycosyl hydrolase family 17 protein [Geothrix sp. SG200]|uniref:glycosyl hydrolase family 17 protein n=1 Tax=Geothrix sp. SG200 TaxID=2922865 RepID=UPI001FACA2D9|nr:glycosyl hydrolase family 17 protein [Geothrix sp. SG200]
MIRRTLLAVALVLSGALRAGGPDLAKPGWQGRALCYSGYRRGQDPDKGRFPTQAQVLEDLRILERHWQIIRLYGSDQHSRDVLEVIRSQGIRLKVMLGIWLSGKPGKAAANRQQVAEGIRLARAYPEVVIAVSVGNETLVEWSDHRLTEPEVIGFVKEVKAAVPCPVTVADDYLYWCKPGNRLVPHLDFITLHSYPIWGRQDIDKGFSGTIDKHAEIQRLYPGKPVVFGEVGWATYTVGAKHTPRAGSEAKQARYLQEMEAWARREGVTTFFFEAFDEPWKGEGTEGHWGLFTVDRKAKPAVQALYPDLKPEGPTSPTYPKEAP